MSITLDLTSQEVAALKQLTELEDDAEAVTKAAKESLRLPGLRELKTVSEKVDLETNWQELVHLERF